MISRKTDTDRTTVYIVYANFNDAVKLIRSAKRKGYTSFIMEPFENGRENKYFYLSKRNNRVYYKDNSYSQFVRNVFPEFLIYRDYGKRKQPDDFELYEVTLTREY